MSDHPTMPRRAATQLGALVLLGLLLSAIGFGGYVGLKYYLGWRAYREARQALADNKLDEARSRFREYLSNWPKDTDAHFLAARTARRLREFKEAEDQLRACKDLGYDQERLLLEHAMMQAQHDTPAPVEGFLMSKVQKDHAESNLILEALIQGYLKTYQLPKAHHCVKLWHERYPDDLQAVFWRGMIWEKLANNRAATADFEEVVAGQPENRAARLHLADMLLNAKKEYQRALEHYEWLRIGDPVNAQIRLGLAGCYVGLNRLEEAQELLDKLLADYPESPMALSECGKLAHQMGQPRQAEELLRRSLAIDPYDPEAVYAYSQVLEQLGRSEEAKHYRGKHEAILTDFRRLSELSEKAVTNPHDASLRYEIGVIFMRNGRENEGVEWLKTALQMNASHRPTLKLLADYCERHGMPEQAAHYRNLAGLER